MIMPRTTETELLEIELFNPEPTARPGTIEFHIYRKRPVAADNAGNGQILVLNQHGKQFITIPSRPVLRSHAP
jgi:hypothetical protein